MYLFQLIILVHLDRIFNLNAKEIYLEFITDFSECASKNYLPW